MDNASGFSAVNNNERISFLAIDITGNANGQRTNGAASGRSQHRNVESVAPEPRLDGRGQGSHETEHYLSNITKPFVALVNRGSKAISILSRTQQLIRPLSSALYYQNPAAIKDILVQGGVFGKIAQMLAVNPRLSSAIHNDSQEEGNRFSQETGNALSQYQPGEVPPDEVISTLQEKIPSHDIQHVRELGRGTICQIDQVRIDGKDYAVKSLSPKLSKAIKSDVDIVTNVILPMASWGGMLSMADIPTFSEALKTFSDETDLSQELKHTERQAVIFEALTNDKVRKNFLTLNSAAGEHPVTVAFKVPEVYPDFSSNKALVMELVDGCSLDREAEIREMLHLWEPAWNNHQRLNSDQIDQVLTGIKEKIRTVYLDAAKQFRFINTDFQPGNMMLKLEGEAITVYFIDHGNCIELKNLAELATHELHYLLISSLFDFFHSRHHSGSAESSVTASRVENDPFEFPSTVSLQSPVPVGLKDLTLRPLNDSAHDRLKNNDIINDMVSIFGPDAEPPGDLIQWCREERSVEDICGKLYEWVTTDWIGGSANRDAILSKSKFVDSLSILLSKAAVELKNFRDLSDFDQRQKPSIKFDNYVNSLGFCHPGSNLMLMRVIAQIKALYE